MGLSNFPCLAEGMLPVLVMNTVFSVDVLKKLVRSALQMINGATESFENEQDPHPHLFPYEVAIDRTVSITQFKYLCDEMSGVCRNNKKNGSGGVECSVCLCRFEWEEVVSELSCKHFFHKSCLDKWFHNKHTTCPLCRSIH